MLLKNPFPPFEHLADYMRLRSEKSIEREFKEEENVINEQILNEQELMSDIEDKKMLRSYLKEYVLEAERPTPLNFFDLLMGFDDDEDDDFW